MTNKTNKQRHEKKRRDTAVKSKALSLNSTGAAAAGAEQQEKGRWACVARLVRCVTASLVFVETLPFGIGAYFTCGKSPPNFLRNFPPFSNFHSYFPSGVLALDRVGQCLLLFSCLGYNRRKHQSLPWQEKVQDR